MHISRKINLLSGVGSKTFTFAWCALFHWSCSFLFRACESCPHHPFPELDYFWWALLVSFYYACSNLRLVKPLFIFWPDHKTSPAPNFSRITASVGLWSWAAISLAFAAQICSTELAGSLCYMNVYLTGPFSSDMRFIFGLLCYTVH